MGAGKILSIIAGIITLLSTFLLVWFTGTPGIDEWGAHGVGLAANVINMFSKAAEYENSMSIPIWAVYIIAVFAILFLIAGLFQLIGAKAKALAIIGSLFPLILGVIVLLGEFNVIEGFMTNLDFILNPLEFVPGVLPYNLDLAGVSIGSYGLLAGGLLGLISGFMSRE